MTVTVDQLRNLADRADRGQLTAAETALLRAGIDQLGRALDAERKLREAQWRHQDAERRVRCQRERAETAEAGQLLLARTIAATSKQTVEQVLADVRAALTAPARETT